VDEWSQVDCKVALEESGLANTKLSRKCRALVISSYVDLVVESFDQHRIKEDKWHVADDALLPDDNEDIIMSWHASGADDAKPSIDKTRFFLNTLNRVQSNSSVHTRYVFVCDSPRPTYSYQASSTKQKIRMVLL
jgi:hypothetical protein